MVFVTTPSPARRPNNLGPALSPVFCKRLSLRWHRTIVKACQGSTGIETVPIDPFELERLIGDLTIFINDMNGGAVQHKLLDLCDRLEAAKRTGEGQLDWI